MPKALHDKLARTAKKLFRTTKSKRAKKYIFGTLAKLKKKGVIK